MKKLDFTPKNVINCVDNEPALWVLKLLLVSTHIIGFHFCKYSAIRIISVSVSDIYILFNPCGVFPFLRLGRYRCGTLTAHHDCSTCNDYFVFVIHFAKNRTDI